MKAYRASVLVDRCFRLGEGPIWDERTQTLLFTDIQANTVFRCDAEGGIVEEIPFDTTVGCFALCESGGMICGTGKGLFLRSVDGTMTQYAEPRLPEGGRSRYNDGKCDDRGRFWAGTLGQGGFFGVTMPDGSFKKLLDGVKISNGLAFSKDRKTLYFNDTALMRVDAFDLDYDRAEISNRRTVFACSREEGGPDGMTIDDDDKLWIARWGGKKISCVDPRTGEEIAEVVTGALQTSSCCFGGRDMKTLFITSSGDGCENTGSAVEGRVFRCDLPVSGAKSYRFGN